jgi:rhamnulose-1-phosphate aldolase/alcohol dehydrogenase
METPPKGTLMQNRWRDQDAAHLDPLDQLVYMSRLVGAETSLVVWGGGNTSVKVTERDFRGRETRVMRVKGSGSDMKSIEPKHFPGIRLEDVAPLLDRDAMDDDEMVAYLEHALMEPGSPRPSIETLLHGFLPCTSIVHSHADAVLSLTNTAKGEAAVREALGDAVAVVGYRRPGFTLSKEVYLALRDRPDATALVLMNHGLITWGESAKESYTRHIDLVTRIEDYLAAGRRGTAAPSAAGVTAMERRRLAVTLAPVLRGALGAERRVVLRFDDSEGVLRFLANPEAERLSQIGAATPDHLIHSKQKPLFVRLPLEDARAAREELRRGVAAYVERYREYVGRYATEGTPSLDPNPRVILVPGLGMWTAGADARRALVVNDIYHHTIDVIECAEAAGGYRSLSEKDAFDAEYWPLELYKLTRLPPERELARRVALVTGAGNGIGRAIALRLAEEGAQVVVTDVDAKAAGVVACEIEAARGSGAAVAAPCDVTSEESVRQAFEAGVLAFGGLDILVSNAGVAVASPVASLSLEDWERSFAVNARGHFLVSREAVRIMKEQGTGGSIIFNATKNVTSPGKDFGAYSAAKAAEAQLARVLAIEHGGEGIRVNMVNPDAVFSGSNLWAAGIREERAAAHGVRPEDLEDFYRQRNLLRLAVRPEDVADAVVFLASDRSSRTTGAMLPVDGGVRDAFVR